MGLIPMLSVSALSVSALMAIPAAAIPAMPQGHPDFFEVSWHLAPDAPRSSPMPVKAGDTIDGGNLYPGRIAILREAIRYAGGKLTLPAGTELIAADNGAIACTRHPRRKLDFRVFNNGAQGYFSCFADTDGDHVFDGSFDVLGLAKDSLILGGRVPKDLAPVTGGRFDEAEATALHDPPRTGIEYLGGRSTFAFVAAMDGAFVQPLYVKADRIGTDIAYAGIVFRITGREKDGILVDLRQGLSPHVIRFQ